MPHDSAPSWRQQCAVLRGLVLDGSAASHPLGGPGFFARSDLSQVERTAARVRSDVFSRKRRGARSLTDLYAGTLAGVDHPALAKAFFRSPWFLAYGELPDRPAQYSAEEAFYRFLCDENIGPADLRFAELADAMIQALVVQPRPAFRVPPEIEQAPFGYFALAELAGRTWLFAAARGSIVRGPVDAAVAAVLRHRGLEPSDAVISATAWRAAVTVLESSGLGVTARKPQVR